MGLHQVLQRKSHLRNNFKARPQLNRRSIAAVATSHTAVVAAVANTSTVVAIVLVRRNRAVVAVAAVVANRNPRHLRVVAVVHRVVRRAPVRLHPHPLLIPPLPQRVAAAAVHLRVTRNNRNQAIKAQLLPRLPRISVHPHRHPQNRVVTIPPSIRPLRPARDQVQGTRVARVPPLLLHIHLQSIRHHQAAAKT